MLCFFAKLEIGQRDLEVYARELLASCAESDAAKERESQAGEVFEDNDSSLSPTKSAPPLVRRLSNAASLLAPEDDLPESCKGAVEVLSRNSPKGTLARLRMVSPSRYNMLMWTNCDRSQCLTISPRTVKLLRC